MLAPKLYSNAMAKTIASVILVSQGYQLNLFAAMFVEDTEELSSIEKIRRIRPKKFEGYVECHLMTDFSSIFERIATTRSRGLERIQPTSGIFNFQRLGEDR